jgi:hypothetical protein
MPKIGHVRPESPVTFLRNRRSRSSGIRDHLGPEYAGGVFFVAMQVGGDVETPGNTIFRSVPPEAGKAEILRCCTMLETWRPGQWRAPF